MAIKASTSQIGGLVKENAKVQLPQISGSTVRLLRRSERSFHTSSSLDCFPIVIEPTGGSYKNSLKEFLRESSSDVKNALHHFGALLFRGWDVTTELKFEESIFSIQGLVPLVDQLKVEPGRDLVPGTKHVYYTNTLRKTGGSFQIPAVSFHTENYYHVEVPTYQFFWAKRTSLLGGETGLVHMGRAYQALPKSTQKKIEKEAVFTQSWPLSQLTELYKIDEKLLESVLESRGLEVVTIQNQKYALLFKQSVLRHPVTGKSALQMNLKDIRAAQVLLKDLVMPYYSGPSWWMHRKAWSNRKVFNVLTSLDAMILKVAGTNHELQADRLYPAPKDFEQLAIGKRFNEDEAKLLALSMLENFTISPYRNGDILAFDNTQVAHAGMPGLGPREIRVIMANTLQLEHPMESGVFDFKLTNKPRLSLRDLILEAREKANSKLNKARATKG